MSPSEEQLRDARRHHELAARQRASSAALVAAEQKECSGLSEEDRDIGPFYHREDITSVTVIDEQGSGGYVSPSRKITGAKIVFRALPAMTAEWLQRVVDCHLARAAALGHDMPEMGYCPLVLEDAHASVSSTGDGFAVYVTSDNPRTVKEIIRRAEALQK